MCNIFQMHLCCIVMHAVNSRWKSCWTYSWVPECHGHQESMLMTFHLDWSTSMQHLPSLKIQIADPMPLSQLHVLHWKDTETGICCMVPGETQAPLTTSACLCSVPLVIVGSCCLLELDRASSCLLHHLNCLATKLWQSGSLAEAVFVPAQSVA